MIEIIEEENSRTVKLAGRTVSFRRDAYVQVTLLSKSGNDEHNGTYLQLVDTANIGELGSAAFGIPVAVD